MQNTVNPKPEAIHASAMKDQHALDLHQYAGNWIWRALECLVEAKDFQSSPKWAAARLNVTVEKVVDGYEGLERLGYVRRNGAEYVKAAPEYHIGAKDMSSDDLLGIHAKLAPQVISKLKPSSKFTTWFFLADNELVAKYAPKFMALYAEMHKEGLQKGLTEVIASEISFANLSENNQSVGGKQ